MYGVMFQITINYLCFDTQDSDNEYKYDMLYRALISNS